MLRRQNGVIEFSNITKPIILDKGVIFKMSTMFNENMTPEMIMDFKKWSRTLGGEDVMEGIEPDLKK